jgi:hypothetical protein
MRRRSHDIYLLKRVIKDASSDTSPILLDMYMGKLEWYHLFIEARVNLNLKVNFKGKMYNNFLS